MPRGKQEKCHFKDCEKFLGPGASVVGYEVDGQGYALKACAMHTQMITTMPRGSWNITAGRELKPIPATFFIKKGT